MKKQHIKKTIRSMFIFLLIICLLTGCKTSEKKQTDLFSVSSDLHCNDHDVLYHVQPFHEFCTE